MATNSLKWWLCIRGWRWMNVQRDKTKTFTEGTRMVGGGDPLRWILHISSLHQLGWCKYCKWASEYYLLLTVLQAGTVCFQAGCWFFLLIVFCDKQTFADDYAHSVLLICIPDTMWHDSNYIQVCLTSVSSYIQSKWIANEDILTRCETQLWVKMAVYQHWVCCDLVFT